MSSERTKGSPLRVLFIGKRHYTNRDALLERFGRIYQLPYWWALAGHEVDLWLVDYHGRDGRTARDGALTAESTPVFRARFFARLLAACFGMGRSRRPDIIVASGDCYLGLLAYVASVFSRSTFVFDVYDRYDVFEGYRRLLGMDPLKFLLRRSDVATFASAKVLEDLKSLSRKTVLVPNGVDMERFRPLPMLESRKQLGLPEGTLLVGYFGSMERERGIEDLIAAVAKLIGDGVDVNLVIGGKADPNISLDHPWLHYLGNIEFSKMPMALASCDVLALPYRLGSFIDNASSCKIAEYMAMERPIVSTRSPNFLQNFPEQAAQLGGLLASPDDVVSLAACLEKQLKAPRLVDMPKGMSWQEISGNALEFLHSQAAREAAV